jgi:hypothetical protein
MAAFAFCYQLTIPDSTETLGKTLLYTPYDGTPTYVPFDELGIFLSTYGSGETTYHFCSRNYPTLQVFGQQSDFGSYNITVMGGDTPCTNNLDCYEGGGGGGGNLLSYCYQIAIDQSIVNENSIQFSYTPYGSQSASTVQARNWSSTVTDGTTKTLYVCSSSEPVIFIDYDPILDPYNYGVTVTGGITECISDTECMPQVTPVNCTLSSWGYGETQETWTAGEWSPCTLTNGSYQRFQTRYVITPASGGGTCTGATIQYEACTPQQSGTVATLTTPTFSGTTANSVTATTTISNNGGSEVTSVTFRIFRNGNLVNSAILSDFRFGIFTQFTGLLENTQYTVQAFAINSTGTGQSQVGTFTTSASGGISTPTTSSLTQTGVTLTSTFTNSAGDQFVRYGLIYKIGNSDNLLVNGQGVIRVESGNLDPTQSPVQLVSSLTGLIANTQYYAKAYVQNSDGATYLYSSAINFTTSSIPQGQPSAQLAISSIALQGSIGTDADYAFITNSAANLSRSYISVIEPIPNDPMPGAYQITATLQEADLNSLTWILQTRVSPSDSNWQQLDQVTRSTDLNTLTPPPMWTYYTYSEDRTQVKFRPGAPGYYRFMFKGSFSNGTQFTVYKELIVGRPTEDIDLAYSTLRQGSSSNIQVTASPVYPEWIPEFPEDGLYGITVTQTGSTIVPSLNIINSTRSFVALWGANSNNERISPTLTIGYSSPFKDALMSNSFSKQFPITVLAPFPAISFSNPAIFNSPVTSGGNVTISVATQYAKSYEITSTLGNGTANNPVTYTNIQAGTYTITARAVNDNSPNEQETVITGTLTVEAAAPIISQLPQQKVGRNLFIDTNTLPYVNLNGSSFSGLIITTQPSQGTLSVNGYRIRYIPNQDYTGTDLFAFSVKSTTNTLSNIVNVSLLVAAPSFNVGVANEQIVFNSTEVGATRNLTVPITNSGTDSKLEIHSLSLDQDFDDFKLLITSGQTETVVASIENIDIEPGQTYNVKIQVQPSGIGVRTARLKIDHN